MTSLGKTLGKLKGCSADELRVRGRQAIATLAERHGLSSSTRLPSDAALPGMLESPHRKFAPADLLSHFRSRTDPCSFGGFEDRAATCNEIRNRFGSPYTDVVVSRADGILSGRFDLLGFRGLSFGDPIDWQLDPVHGKRSPLAHWSHINYLDPNVAGDKKITWELNRHQFFMTLGRAYLLTSNERYAECFLTNLVRWMDTNQPKQGINWSSSLEIAFRSVSWIWALQFFRDSGSLTEQMLVKVLKHIYLNASHLETYLSTYFSPNTHLTGEALGLYYIGTAFPEFKRAATWRDTGKQTLLEQLARQVRDDGVYFEQSTYYHRYTTDFYTHFLLLLRARGEEHTSVVEEKLQLLLDHLMSITRPDGTSPLLGDDDGGKLVQLEERSPDDFRAALSTGAVLFGRGDYKFVSGGLSEETLWLTGAAGTAKFDALEAVQPAFTTRGFDTGGYYVMRDGWSQDANYMLIDCGPHGVLNCGHAHADALAIDVAAGGRNFLCDAGTYTYTASIEERNRFRSTTAHNSLTIDGESSSEPGETPFAWKSTAASHLRRWLTTSRFDYFEGSHDGFRRLPSPATHSRSVLFIKGEYWIICDRVTTEGRHKYDLRFNFAPGVELNFDPIGQPALLKAMDGRKQLMVVGVGGDWKTGDGQVSRCYGSAEKNQAAVLSADAAEHQFISVLLPSDADKNIYFNVSQEDGQLAIDREKVLDRFMLGSGKMTTSGSITTNFEALWLRRSPGVDAIEEFIAIGGSHLSVDGKVLVNFADTMAHVSGKIDDEGGWVICAGLLEHQGGAVPGVN
jgi:hypothetical protein